MLDADHPHSVAEIRTRVGAVLADFLDRQVAVLGAVSPDATPLVGCVRDLVSGGKRLRPAFCYWGWRGAGGPPAETEADGIVRAAAALELFQAAALIHDDVMDDSDTRRGLPAAHKRFAGLHRDRGWAGHPERFGLAGAVLAGDLCLAWSDQVFAAADLAPGRLAAGRVVFDRMRTELMGGQYLDMLEQVRPSAGDDPVRRARQVIRYKSAKYSVEHPVVLGGTLAGARGDLLDRYSAFGLLLGEAFQLRDDLLGVFGDPSRTGKPAGDDLREGKRTVLVAYAVESADRHQAAALGRLLGDPELDMDGVETLRAILIRTGAVARVESLIAEDVEGARKALADADLPTEARSALDSLVVAATERAA